MEIKISIEKKHLWILSLFIVTVGFVIAYGGNAPQTMGHTIGEVDGVDQKVIDVMNGQAATYLSGKDIIEGRLYTLGSQSTLNPTIGGGRVSLADYTNVYGRIDRAFEYKGCLRAITEYCNTQGYSFSVPITTTCGWNVGQDAACPDAACNLQFLCLKVK